MDTAHKVCVTKSNEFTRLVIPSVFHWISSDNSCRQKQLKDVIRWDSCLEFSVERNSYVLSSIPNCDIFQSNEYPKMITLFVDFEYVNELHLCLPCPPITLGRCGFDDQNDGSTDRAVDNPGKILNLNGNQYQRWRQISSTTKMKRTREDIEINAVRSDQRRGGMRTPSFLDDRQPKNSIVRISGRFPRCRFLQDPWKQISSPF